MSVFLASDWHLGHKLAAELRGFASVQEHDDAIIAAALEVLTKRTKLFILGDVALSARALERLREVPGVKALVLGNHDTLPAKRYLEYFDDLHGVLRYRGFLLTHIPVLPSLRYRANLHGHVHSASGSEVSPWHLNLVVERWGWKPIPFDELAARGYDGPNRGDSLRAACL